MPLQAIRRVPTRDLAAAARLSTETTVLVSVADVALIALLRYFGKRALSKFNAFDVIITVAVGSCLASAVMTKDITLADGVVAFSLLLILQRLFAGLALCLGWFGRYVKNQPLLIIYRGAILWDRAREEQLGELEIFGALRNAGVAAVENVLALVLEPDGSFSVVPMGALKPGQRPTALLDVKGVSDFEPLEHRGGRG